MSYSLVIFSLHAIGRPCMVMPHTQYGVSDDDQGGIVSSSTAEETGPLAQDGSGAGLIAFLNWTILRNELVDSTASALRTGCQRVLAVEDDPDGIDLRTA